MLIDEAFKTIQDVENFIVKSQRWLQGQKVSLFVEDFCLPSEESSLVLQSNDLVRVRLSSSYGIKFYVEKKKHSNPISPIKPPDHLDLSIVTEQASHLVTLQPKPYSSPACTMKSDDVKNSHHEIRFSRSDENWRQLAPCLICRENGLKTCFL